MIYVYLLFNIVQYMCIYTHRLVLHFIHGKTGKRNSTEMRQSTVCQCRERSNTETEGMPRYQKKFKFKPVPLPPRYLISAGWMLHFFASSIFLVNQSSLVNCDLYISLFSLFLPEASQSQGSYALGH